MSDRALIDGIVALTKDRERMVNTFVANPRALFQSLTHLADGALGRQDGSRSGQRYEPETLFGIRQPGDGETDG